MGTLAELHQETPLQAAIEEIDAELTSFGEATGVSAWLEARDGTVLAGTPAAGRPTRQTLVVGDALLGTVCAVGGAPEGRLRLAAYLRDHVARIIDHEATVADFARTTAWQWKEINFLLDASQALDVTRTERETCSIVLERTARLLGAERASVLVLNESGSLEIVASQGVNPAIASAVRVQPGEGIAGWVFAHAMPILAETERDLPEGVRLNPDITRARKDATFISAPFVSSPLIAGSARRADATLGVLNVCGKRGGGSFTAEDLKLVQAAAIQIASALRNIRLLAQVKAAEHLRQEFATAAEIQASLLPRVLPEVPGLELFGWYRPATVVGGDYYDLVPSGPDGFYVIVADVSGHGLAAALFMSNARSATRTLLAADPSPTALAEALNARIVEDAGDTGMFLTAICGRYDVRHHRLALVNCGHTLPVIVRANGEVVTPTAGCPPIGLLPHLDIEPVHLHLGAGDLLFLYTDALMEASAAGGEMFGLDRVVAALLERRGQPLPEIAAQLFQLVQEWGGTPALEDDLTMVLIRRPLEGSALVDG